MTAIKLTLAQALEIRRRYEAGVAVTSLAADTGVSRSVISEVIRGVHPLVRGVPSLSGRRRPAIPGGSPPLRGMSKGARASIGTGRSPARYTEQQKRQYRCDTCGARKGEYCTNMQGGAIGRDSKKAHPGRGPKGER